MDNLAPIILFVYNRPEHTLRTLQSLMKNKEAKESVLYIFCDGPKPNATQTQVKKIEETRKVVKNEQWCKETIIVESEVNKGLAKSIIKGVTDVINKHEKAIILEDDLTLSSYFLQYFNGALNLYKSDEDVIAIHGFVYPAGVEKIIADTTFFIRDPGCLGWATWKRAWDLFDNNTSKLYDQLKDKGLQKEFNFYGGYPFMRQMKKQITGKTDSWAINWRAVAYLHNKLTLYPAYSLVKHEGNDPEATHHNTAIDYLNTDVYNQPVLFGKISIKNNYLIEKLFGKFLHRNAGMNIQSKIKHKVYKIYKRLLFPNA